MNSGHIYAVIKIRGVGKAAAAAMEQLSHLAHRSAYALSGIEAQRVAIARTAVLGSGVYLLDEPTANVDGTNIDAIEELMANLARERRAAVVFTTHSQRQAERLAESKISMDAGRIV